MPIEGFYRDKRHRDSHGKPIVRPISSPRSDWSGQTSEAFWVSSSGEDVKHAFHAPQSKQACSHNCEACASKKECENTKIVFEPLAVDVPLSRSEKELIEIRSKANKTNDPNELRKLAQDAHGVWRDERTKDGMHAKEARQVYDKINAKIYRIEHSSKASNKFSSKIAIQERNRELTKMKWDEIHAMEQKAGREHWDIDKAHAERLRIVDKYEKLIKRPNLKPLIYRMSIGHYGGMYVDVPEEKFEEFKSYFPPREFPRDVRMKADVREQFTYEGEEQFRKKFPRSNVVKTVFFADRSKGLKRLEEMEIPRTE